MEPIKCFLCPLKYFSVEEKTCVEKRGQTVAIWKMGQKQPIFRVWAARDAPEIASFQLISPLNAVCHTGDTWRFWIGLSDCDVGASAFKMCMRSSWSRLNSCSVMSLTALTHLSERQERPQSWQYCSIVLNAPLREQAMPPTPSPPTSLFRTCTFSTMKHCMQGKKKGIGKHRASHVGAAGSCDFGNLFHPSQVVSQVAQMVRCLPAMWETCVQSLGREDPQEKEVATHSRTPAWRIPWREEPGGLQSVGWQRVRHNWATFLSFHPTFSSRGS